MRDLLTAKEAAYYLRISLSTLARYRVNGNGPAYFKSGRRVLYRRSCLDDFIEKNLRFSTVSKACPETGRLPGAEDI